MEIYQSGDFRLTLSDDMNRELFEMQRLFMPEDTKAGMIQTYLDTYPGSQVCSKQLYTEALHHAFEEPKQWEIREINEIMNNCIDGWKQFPIRECLMFTESSAGGNVFAETRRRKRTMKLRMFSVPMREQRVSSWRFRFESTTLVSILFPARFRSRFHGFL